MQDNTFIDKVCASADSTGSGGDLRMIQRRANVRRVQNAAFGWRCEEESQRFANL